MFFKRLGLLIFLFQFFSLFISLEGKIPAVCDLTLEQKVGQLLMVHFNGSYLNADARRLIEQAHVGGFIYYNWANSLDSPHQIYKMSKSLQDFSPIPLLIAVDQEGGAVVRLKQGFTVFPSNYAQGQIRQPLIVKQSAYAIGEELANVGINMNLAPVVDVNSNPQNPIIGIRAFSSNPQEVAQLGEMSIQGYQQANTIAVLKHFPGHGDTSADSHMSLPVLQKTRQQLEAMEFFPFEKLAKKASAILTSHLFVPALDPDQCVTFSSRIVRDELRNKMQFKGVILSDSLVMQGLLSICPSIQEAVIRCFEAGHDILLLGGKQLLSTQNGLELKTDDIIAIHGALVAAFKSGRLSEKCLDESVARILQLKQQYRIDETKEPNFNLQSVSTPAHRQLAQEIATQATALIYRQEDPIFSLKTKKIMIVAPEMVRQEILGSDLMHMGQATHLFTFTELNPNLSEIEEIKKFTQEADVCIFCSYKGWKHEGQKKLFDQLQDKPLILIVLGDPQDASTFKQASLILCTFSPDQYSIQAAAHLISRITNNE